MSYVKQHQEKVRQEQLQPKTPKVFGVKLTVEQNEILKDGGFIFLENMTNSKGKQFSGYVFTDDKQQKYFALKNHPDEFVKYGAYEMRAMDKRLIEAGCITEATVKWYDGRLAHPYLWKPDAVQDDDVVKLSGYSLVKNSDYCLSWGDPREKVAGTTRVESQNVGQTAYEEPAQSGSDNSQSSGGSPSDAVSDFGNTVAKAITDSASTVGGLFDFNLSPTEEQQPTIHKKKKPEKKKGRRIL